MTKAPRRARSRDAEPLERLHYAVMLEEALRLARYISAGLELTPGDEARLGKMPPTVQTAVAAQRRNNSRYLPITLRKHRQALEQAREEGSPIKPENWNPALARHLRAPHGYDDPGRIVTVRLPGSTNGSRQITAAIAADAGVSPATVRAWADQMREALDDADRADKAAFIGEMGAKATAKDLKRRPGKRRRPAAAWSRGEK